MPAAHEPPDPRPGGRTRRRFLQETATLSAALATAVGEPGALAAERHVPGPRTDVRRHRGRPCFFVDGRPYARPAFETYVPEVRYFRQFAEAGTEVFSFSVNLGPGFGPSVWVGPDDWDYSRLDEIAQRVLEASPRALILPRIYLSSPAWWVERNLDECQVLSHGGRHYREGRGHGRDGNAFPSLASAKWRDDTAAALTRLIEHMQASGYGDRLFGYMLTELMSEEWYHWSIHTGELSDYSVHAAHAFRDWLRRKYRSARRLRDAWGRPIATFDEVVPPSAEERLAGRGERTFRDPAAEMPVIDWYQFYNELVPDTMEVFLRAAKEASGFRKVVGAFYCYLFEFGGDPEFGHNAMSRLLRSRHLDFVMVTASYHSRALGSGADYARSPITSVGLHGKLWYHDNDTVSFRYDEVNASNPDRPAVERYRRELGVTATAEETIWQYRRGAGFVLGHGVYQSFFDLHGGYFDDPRLMEEVARLNRLLGASVDQDLSSVSQILVVSDETSCSYATFESNLLQQSLQPAQAQLAKAGAPHDSILLDDLGRADLSRIRLVIFLNPFHLTSAQRALIRRRVLRDGRTVVWCAAPGLFDGTRRSPEAMSRLTGIRLEETGRRARARVELTPRAMAFLERWAPTAEPAPAALMGGEHVWTDAIAARDPAALVLGCREGTVDAALATKEMPGWRAVFSLNPALPSRWLRALARSAGAHIYNDRDDTLYASRQSLCVNADGAGERVLCFPSPVDLFDAVSGQLLCRDATAFARFLRDKETLLLRVERRTPPVARSA